jgi:hypothetical protein
MKQGVRRLQIPPQSLVLRHRAFLKRLYFATVVRKSEKEVKELLRRASTNEIKTLCEITHNFLSGRFPRYSKTLVDSLRKRKGLLRKLACPKTNLTVKRKALQKGGILTILASLLAPLLSGLIAKAI